MGCVASILATDSDLETRYSLDKEVGCGVEGSVWLATDKTTGKHVAIKLIPRCHDLGLGPEKVRSEIQLQARLSHVNVVELKQVLLTPRHLGIVMSYEGGGDLHAYVQHYKLDEVVARYFFRQIVEGLDYCHHNNIAHRDLKLANFILSCDKPPRVKLCDFGCARKWDTSAVQWGSTNPVSPTRVRRFKTFAGTPAYMSPQVLQSAFYPTNTYDAVSADVWSLGIVLCHLFFGQHTPYWMSANAFRDENRTMQARIESMKKQNWVESDEFVKANVDKLSPEVRDLLDQIFIADEFKRITVQGIKEHPWFTAPLPANLQIALDDMAAEQELRCNLHRATVSLAANRHDTAQPESGEFATIDLLVDLAQKTGKMPGGAAGEKLFCLDMAHMELDAHSVHNTISVACSPATSPFASDAGAGAAAAADDDTQHSTTSYTSSLQRAAAAGDRSTHLTGGGARASAAGAVPGLLEGSVRMKRTLSIQKSSSGLLVGRYILERTPYCSTDGGGQMWLGSEGGATSMGKARSVHAGTVFFDAAARASEGGSVRAKASFAGGSTRAGGYHSTGGIEADAVHAGNRTIHGGTAHAAAHATTRGTFYTAE